MQPKLARKFGLRVKTARRELGLSQEDFAERAGMDRTYISGIERGIRNPTLAVIARLAAALGISVAELMRGL